MSPKQLIVQVGFLKVWPKARLNLYLRLKGRGKSDRFANFQRLIRLSLAACATEFPPNDVRCCLNTNNLVRLCAGPVNAFLILKEKWLTWFSVTK